MKDRMPSITSIYAHFPFCETKCHYCDFFSLPEAQIESGERARIYRAIETELERFKARLAPRVRTVFLGGGTPSLVPLETMESFVGRLPADSTTEITMEANPSSITGARAREWRRIGINRVSMGVQALDDERLKWLGRIHSKRSVFEALDALFTAGFENVSIDYIVGVTGQTTDMIASELGDALARFPHIRHVSAYLLTLKSSNAKFKQLPSEDEQLAHLRKVRDVLATYGFAQYEISNFARKDSRALHNENYWLGGGYAGIGPSAHSFWPARTRTKNWASLGKYCELIEAEGQAVEWTKDLSEEERRVEYLMLRLRRADGVNLRSTTPCLAATCWRNGATGSISGSSATSASLMSGFG